MFGFSGTRDDGGYPARGGGFGWCSGLPAFTRWAGPAARRRGAGRGRRRAASAPSPARTAPAPRAAARRRGRAAPRARSAGPERRGRASPGTRWRSAGGGSSAGSARSGRGSPRRSLLRARRPGTRRCGRAPRGSGPHSWLAGADVSFFDGIPVQLPLEQAPAAEQPALHRAGRDPEHGGDLGVGQPLEVAQHDGVPEVGGQTLDRLEDGRVDHVAEQLALRVVLRGRHEEGQLASRGGRCLRLAGDLLDDLVVPALALALPEVDVPANGKEPALRGGSGGVLVPGAEGAEERFLDEVLGVRRDAAGQTEREAVDGVELR